MFGHVTRHLTAYHHGELSSRDRQRVENHVAECSRCRQQFEDVRFAVKMASSLFPASQRLERAVVVRPAKSRAFAVRSLQLASVAIALVVIIAGIYTWRQSRLPAWDLDVASKASK